MKVGGYEKSSRAWVSLGKTETRAEPWSIKRSPGHMYCGRENPRQSGVSGKQFQKFHPGGSDRLCQMVPRTQVKMGIRVNGC